MKRAGKGTQGEVSSELISADDKKIVGKSKVRRVFEVGMGACEDTVRSRLSSKSHLQLQSLLSSPRRQSCISSESYAITYWCVVVVVVFKFPLKQHWTFCPAAGEALGGARLAGEDILPLSTPFNPAIVSSYSRLSGIHFVTMVREQQASLKFTWKGSFHFVFHLSILTSQRKAFHVPKSLLLQEKIIFEDLLFPMVVLRAAAVSPGACSKV